MDTVLECDRGQTDRFSITKTALCIASHGKNCHLFSLAIIFAIPCEVLKTDFFLAAA